MDYFKAFEKIKSALDKADIAPADGNFAIQIRMTDEDCGGTLYIQLKDKQIFVEPYDYYDNDVDVMGSFADIEKILKGRLSAKNAANDGRITVNGNAEGFFALAEALKPKKAPAKKPAAKKPAAKAPAKKTPAKKAEAKPAEKKAEVKPAEKKSAEKKAEVKPVAKKSAEKAPAKAVKKETEAAPVAKETKKTAPASNETIAEVVKKEIKPEKKTTGK